MPKSGGRAVAERHGGTDRSHPNCTSGIGGVGPTSARGMRMHHRTPGGLGEVWGAAATAPVAGCTTRPIRVVVKARGHSLTDAA